MSSPIESLIIFLRNQRVILDAELAALYGVSTKRLNEQVKRNRKRFPPDFMFRLTMKESQNLRSQFATSTRDHGGRRYRPFAFTEQGVAMLSSVLNSERAVQVNIAIMRVFIRLRQLMISNHDLVWRLEKIETKLGKHDKEIKIIFETIHQLVIGAEKPKRQIGFSPSHLRSQNATLKI